MKLTDYLVRLPSGELGHYEVDESIPFAVAVLIEQDDEILLTRQYRFPLNAWIFDLPGGAGEVGELPEVAARREVQEELGLRIDSIVALQHFFPNPGRSICFLPKSPRKVWLP
ncbi:NUDIX hydrolase [Paenarthrobacter sp. JL.01a]|uniref:NUDIX hydrolase n=1 Tax=Paenarthrobacter sp. JL.01a TaxID=2979324 RepID=UPI0021C710E5|nr:NUDIX hydrolase [Paenarthrobacter sp. JL.01a]UXM91823.1 NUDIX hydrolase [Paenarthrobacter sp. JL.01a]